MLHRALLEHYLCQTRQQMVLTLKSMPKTSSALVHSSARHAKEKECLECLDLRKWNLAIIWWSKQTVYNAPGILHCRERERFVMQCALHRPNTQARNSGTVCGSETVLWSFLSGTLSTQLRALKKRPLEERRTSCRLSIETRTLRLPLSN